LRNFICGLLPEKGNDGLEIITHNGIGRVAFRFSGLLLTYMVTLYETLLLFILSLLAIYTYAKKNFGQHIAKKDLSKYPGLNAILISIIVGFMMVLLVQELEAFSGGVYPLMGFDFLHASANAKWSIWQLILAPFVYLCLKGR
jgi:hypothetical protein